MMQDQTEPVFSVGTGVLEPGTAVLLLLEPSGTRRKALVYVESFADFEAIGKSPDVVAGKWVPESVARYEQLKNSPCAGVVCVNSCVHPGCVCDPVSQTCV